MVKVGTGATCDVLSGEWNDFGDEMHGGFQDDGFGSMVFVNN
jgi:hypothetical protein